jgi:[histone H3]-trimethyl-L-lysine4 demethylase
MSCRYHGKCLKIARGKVKDEDKYTCPICDWRVKIPRDAARPKIEDLQQWFDEIPMLPFQPAEEEILESIIKQAQDFRNHIASYCNPVLSTEAEADTQRFYLRKIEGADILLAYETNFFRQELHKWCPVAPEAPPLLEESKSTRKPRPTKLQKILQQYGVDDPDDLPEPMKAKANSLKRKAANAEAAAAAAAAASSVISPRSSGFGSSLQNLFSRNPNGGAAGGSNSHHSRSKSSGDDTSLKGEPMDVDNETSLPPTLFTADGGAGPQILVESGGSTLEDRLLSGEEDLNLHPDIGKSKALEILRRTEVGRKRAEEIYGPDVWAGDGGSAVTVDGAVLAPEDEGEVNKMFDDLTNHDDDEDGKKVKDGQQPTDGAITAESLESERNGMDALLDGD